jgi:hypothetical protein
MTPSKAVGKLRELRGASVWALCRVAGFDFDETFSGRRYACIYQACNPVKPEQQRAQYE